MPAIEMPGPTADSEPEPAMRTDPERLLKAEFIPEPEPNAEFVGVCEPATASVVKGILVESSGWIGAPPSCLG